MDSEKNWDKFRNSGFLWWTNRILHTFGWSIAVEVVHDKVVSAYPVRVGFRGFSRGSEVEGFKKVSQYMVDNASQLNKEIGDE